jgi:hypothetical protein
MPITPKTGSLFHAETQLRPGEPVVVGGNDWDDLLAPAVTLDLLWPTPVAAIATWHPPHRVTSCNTAA